jgi:hypothetical protein
MPKASTLAKMSDEEYKKLTSLQLQQYNNDMPEIDYADPYVWKGFPKMVYKDVNGQVQSTTVKNQKELDSLGDGWVFTLEELGVETAPAAAAVAVTSFSVPMPVKSVGDALPQDDPPKDRMASVRAAKAAKRATAGA